MKSRSGGKKKEGRKRREMRIMSRVRADRGVKKITLNPYPVKTWRFVQ